ncbi:MAG: hypothetical protein M1831_003768 [Alyxoria varia]|nr:MAG: hypothetical protein M1831_003768 [Alyxoria varia]
MDTTPTQPRTVEEAKRNIKFRHLDQLTKLPLEDEQPEADEPCSIGTDILIKWTKDQRAHIDNALKHRVRRTFRNAFFAFMESTTIYLRDEKLVKKAVEAHAYGDVEEALTLLNKSEDNIKKLIRFAQSITVRLYTKDYSDFPCRLIYGIWIFKWLALIHKHPKDHPHWVEPYCLAFFSRSDKESAPLVGLAFKVYRVPFLQHETWRWLHLPQGTNPLRKGEVDVDYNFQLVTAAAPTLYGSQVSDGVYTALFGNYEKSNPPSPIADLVRDIHWEDHTPAYVSPSSSGAQKRPIPTSPSATSYSLGSPRIGGTNFSASIAEHVKGSSSSAWRIANDQDIVPQVPPV